MNYTFDSVAEDKTESIFVGDVNNLFVSTKIVHLSNDFFSKKNLMPSILIYIWNI